MENLQSDLIELELSEKSNGTGTILIHSEPQLEFIENARKVYSLIIQIQNKHRILS